VIDRKRGEMAKQRKRIRRSIPQLPKGAASIGKEGLVERSFDDVRGGILRSCSGKRFQLSIWFTEAVGDALVVCYTNLESPDGSWRNVPFKRRKNRYYFSVRPSIPGIYGFRVRYSFDKGSSWIWDRAPLMSVHVDPFEMRDVRCYTFIPNVSGQVEHWIEELDRIKGMGFNMVHLLPVTEMDFSESPYSARNLFAFDPAYYDPEKYSNGMDAFETYVEAAKKRQIALCIDLVLNHIGPGSNVALKHPDWIMADSREKDGMKRSGCWHMNEWLKWGDLVKIDYDHPNEEKKMAVREYMKAYALFWANYADYTGGMVRLDNLHNSDEDFIEEVLDALRKEYPHLIIHAEFFSDANTLLKRAKDWDINLFLANQWEYPYAEHLRDYLGYLHGISGQIQYYTPVNSHDTGAPVQLFGSTEALVPRYFIVALMTCGKIGMAQGGEFGLPKKVEFIGRHRTFPHQEDPWIVDRITRINRLLATHEALHLPQNLLFVDEKHGAIIAAYREIDKKHGLLLMANLDTKSSHVLTVDLEDITGSSVHTLEDQLDGDQPISADAACEFTIPPSGIAAYLVSV
jgi:hypothetical protein